jgi:hemoglobin
MDKRTMFERVGGQPFFDALVDRFYAEVERDEVLRPLYPKDMSGSKRRLALFLGQYWGGPPIYSEQRGHPRLRARHMPFRIGAAERDAWMRAMEIAVAEADIDELWAEEILTYFARAADWMINVEEDAAAPKQDPRVTTSALGLGPTRRG